MLADLELEGVVPPAVEHLLGLGDVAGSVAAGERPKHRQAFPHPAAHQFADRQAQALALGVQQGGLDGTLGEVVADEGLGHLLDDLRRTAGIGAPQQGGEIGVDGQLDALGALFAIGQAADGRALADTDHAVRAMDLH